MGIVAPFAELILFEHAYRPIGGRVLTIGRQTIHLTPQRCERLLTKYGIKTDRAGFDLDNSTRFGRDSAGKVSYVTDKSLFRLLGIEELDVLDVSDYEGANIVFDLSEPNLPSELVEQYDFIVNGSCLDNMFDPAQGIRNLSRMLRPGGRVAHLEHSSNFNGPYLIFTPAWFLDYYVVNDFADCKAYLGIYPGEIPSGLQLYDGPWHLIASDPKSGSPRLAVIPRSAMDYMTVVIAEKGLRSTSDVRPIQQVYRSAEMQRSYEGKLEAMASSARPIFGQDVETQLGGELQRCLTECAQLSREAKRLAARLAKRLISYRRDGAGWQYRGRIGL